MKLEVGKEFKVRLRGYQINQAKLNPEWIISETKETDAILEPDGKTIVNIVSKTTKTSTVRLYVDNRVPESTSKVPKTTSKTLKEGSKPQK